MLSSAEVLDLHTKLMSSYDAYWESTLFLASIDESRLGQLKDFINRATSFEVCLLTDRLNLNHTGEAIAKIEQAVFIAFNIARNAAKDAYTLKEFRSEFRKAYDVALRIELYRQFISTISKTSKILGIKSEVLCLTNSVEEIIEKDIEQFQSIATNFSEIDQRQLITLKNKLSEYLQELKTTSNDHVEQFPPKYDLIYEAAFDVEKKARKLIRSYQIQYEHERSWGPFLKNLLINLVLIATGVGALVSLGLLVYRAAAGRHVFFDKPMLIKRPVIAAEEKLLSPEDENPYSFFNQSLDDLSDVQLGLEELDNNNNSLGASI